MIERQLTGTGCLIMTEADVTIETPKGRKKYDAGSMFLVGAEVPEEIGDRFDVGTVMVYGELEHWYSDPEFAVTKESEVSLRRKIVKAENRRWWWRSAIIGLFGGAGIELVRLIADAIP